MITKEFKKRIELDSIQNNKKELCKLEEKQKTFLGTGIFRNEVNFLKYEINRKKTLLMFVY